MHACGVMLACDQRYTPIALLLHWCLVLIALHPRGLGRGGVLGPVWSGWVV